MNSVKKKKFWYLHAVNSSIVFRISSSVWNWCFAKLFVRILKSTNRKVKYLMSTPRVVKFTTIVLKTFMIMQTTELPCVLTFLFTYMYNIRSMFLDFYCQTIWLKRIPFNSNSFFLYKEFVIHPLYLFSHIQSTSFFLYYYIQP